MNEVIRESQPKARKEHKCELCGGKITIGEVYSDKFIVGDWVGNWKEHTYCSDLTEELNMYEDREGISSCDFWEDIEVYLKDRGVKYKDLKEALVLIRIMILNDDAR